MTTSERPTKHKILISAAAVLLLAMGIAPSGPAAAQPDPQVNQLIASGSRVCEAHRSVGSRATLRPGSFQTRLEAINTGTSFAPNTSGQRTHYHRPDVSGGGWRVFGNPPQATNPQGTCG